MGITFFCIGPSVTQRGILAKFVGVICYISEQSPFKDHTSDKAREGIFYSTTKYCIVQYSTVYYTLLYYSVMYCTMYHTILYRKILNNTIHIVYIYEVLYCALWVYPLQCIGLSTGCYIV